MQAILLAAGLGSRLGALTAQLPKALIPVGGVPLLAYAVRFAQAVGARDITVVGGYGYDPVAAQGAGRGLPVRVLRNPALRGGNAARVPRHQRPGLARGRPAGRTRARRGGPARRSFWMGTLRGFPYPPVLAPRGKAALRSVRP